MSNSHQPPKSANPSEKLVSAIEKLLRPLVRLMLSYQITFPVFTSILKQAYIDVAESDFELDGKRPSDSRINLLTGVHRKDVKKLRGLAKGSSSHSRTASTGAQIIAHWLGTKDLVDKKGNPKPIPLARGKSNTFCFEDLVTKVVKQDIRPRVVLDEWVRLEVAYVDDDNNVILNNNAFTPTKGFDEKVYFFGKNLQDHINASSHNLMGHTPPFFDRSVYYDGLTQQSVEELAKLADTLGMNALTQMNKHALTRQTKDKGKPEATNRTNFGVFNFNEKLQPENKLKNKS